MPLLFSCSGKPSGPEQTPKPETQATVEWKESQGVINKSTPYPMVTKCELDTITGEFGRRIFTSMAGTTPLPTPVFKFSLKSLRLLLEVQKLSGVASPLMLVHYGLDGHDQMTYGIAFTNATGLNDKFVIPDAFYIPNNSNDLAPYIGIVPWMDVFASKYTAEAPNAKVFIKRTNAAIEPYDPKVHTRFVTFRSSKVLDFIEDNTPPATGTSLVADVIEIVSYAHLKSAAGEYHHGIAFVPWSGSTRMVDDVPTRQRFALRALDLGSPCPQNCEKFEEAYKGMDVPGCPERVMLK